jgi:hypothetical protein
MLATGEQCQRSINAKATISCPYKVNMQGKHQKHGKIIENKLEKNHNTLKLPVTFNAPPKEYFHLVSCPCVKKTIF